MTAWGGGRSSLHSGSVRPLVCRGRVPVRMMRAGAQRRGVRAWLERDGRRRNEGGEANMKAGAGWAAGRMSGREATLSTRTPLT